jgi:hypothetical protein
MKEGDFIAMLQRKNNRTSKTHISAVSVSEMAPDQQALFEKAVDALLADLIQSLDRLTEGNIDELATESLAG